MSFLLGFGVIFFYVDEGGDPHPHREPLLQGGTPLFCLSAVAVHASRWRELDRALFQLKRAYFSREMQGFTARNPDMRPEHYEVKGRQLVKPSHAGSRRNRVFTFKILDLAQQLDVRLFAAVWQKNPANPVDAMSMYTQGLQVLAERFHHHCAQAGELGVIVADGRTRNLDFQVAASHLSYIFGNPVGRNYTTLVEAPMFVDSVLSAGVQLADLLGSCIYGCYYHRRCATLSGLFVGNQLAAQDQFAANPAGPWTKKTPAHDYSHCQQFWQRLIALQFVRTDVPAPGPGQTASGYWGFRELM